jgi:putative Holliday junction resolvase
VVIKYDGKLSLKYKIYNMITIEDFKIKHSNKVRFIGLDLGSKRIGVSICDERQSIATPFKTINKTNTKELIDQLKIIIEENNIGGIIVGNPVNMDGSIGRSAQSVNDVASNISKSIDLPLILWDERLSTVGAFNLSSLLDVNVSKRVKTIDQNAAAFILQGAIDFLNN